MILNKLKVSSHLKYLSKIVQEFSVYKFFWSLSVLFFFGMSVLTLAKMEHKEFKAWMNMNENI